MDTSSAAAECVTLMAAAGYVVHTFPTGQGNVIGNPIVPVIKISGTPRTVRTMSEHIDVDVSGILRRDMTLEEAGDTLIEMTLRTANGRLTAAEALGHREFVLTKLYRAPDPQHDAVPATGLRSARHRAGLALSAVRSSQCRGAAGLLEYSHYAMGRMVIDRSQCCRRKKPSCRNCFCVRRYCRWQLACWLAHFIGEIAHWPFNRTVVVIAIIATLSAVFVRPLAWQNRATALSRSRDRVCANRDASASPDSDYKGKAQTSLRICCGQYVSILPGT